MAVSLLRSDGPGLGRGFYLTATGPRPDLTGPWISWNVAIISKRGNAMERQRCPVAGTGSPGLASGAVRVLAGGDFLFRKLSRSSLLHGLSPSILADRGLCSGHPIFATFHPGA